MPSQHDRIVELEQVHAASGGLYAVGLVDATLCLTRGEAAIVSVPHTGLSTALADLCCGLQAAESGAVRFLGRRWGERSHGQAARDRGRIGRVWLDPAWVGNLNIDENILLPQRHHTRRSETELREEARTLACTFGLDDLPRTRPAWTPEGTRRKAQWVRALLGAPDLLLLEYPDDEADDVDRVRLADAVEQARTQGAAVIWITARSSLALSTRPGAAHQAELTDTTLTWRPQKNRILETVKDDARE